MFTVPDVPACLQSPPDSRVADEELLARLAFAEGLSTGCAERGAEIFEGIAWGVMNRVRLAEVSAGAARRYGKGVRGVVFKPGQFNPAVSKRSRFAKVFACPTSDPRFAVSWPLAKHAAETASGDPKRNPLLLTEWEKQKGLSLITYFYYPKSEQATPKPPAWADTSASSRTFVRNAPAATECLWFFRIEKPW